MLKRYGIAAFALLSLYLASCGKSPDTLHILTDKTELAVAAELYGGLNDDVLVTLRHVDVIDSRVIEREQPGIVIGENLNSPSILNLLEAVEIDANPYDALSGPLNPKGIPILVPLSFELPIVMARRDVMAQLPDTLLIRSRDIKAMEADFVRRDDLQRLTRLGFSPSWNPESYVDIVTIESANAFPADMEEVDAVLFTETVNEIQTWIVESAGDLESDQVFSERYRYVPDDVLLTEGRIRFARTDFHSWASLPSLSVEQLDIRYFAGDRKIPVPSITWAGVPKRSSSKHSEAFLDWLLMPETQSLLMERWEQEGLVVFGFLDGLSSLPEVNETVLPDREPSILGMIPEDHYLAPNPLLPDRWARIRSEVVIPWFEDSIYSQDFTGTLAEAYRRWDLSSLDQSE